MTKVVYRGIFYGDRIEIDDILWDICFMWSQDIGSTVRNVKHFIFEVPSMSISLLGLQKKLSRTMS